VIVAARTTVVLGAVVAREDVGLVPRDDMHGRAASRIDASTSLARGRCSSAFHQHFIESHAFIRPASLRGGRPKTSETARARRTNASSTIDRAR